MVKQWFVVVADDQSMVNDCVHVDTGRCGGSFVTHRTRCAQARCAVQALAAVQRIISETWDASKNRSG